MRASGRRWSGTRAAVLVGCLLAGLAGCGDDDGSAALSDAEGSSEADPAVEADPDVAADPACQVLTAADVEDVLGHDPTVRSMAGDGQVGPCSYAAAATVTVMRSDPAAGAVGAEEWYYAEREKAEATGRYQGLTEPGEVAFKNGDEGPDNWITVFTGDDAFMLIGVVDPDQLRDLAERAVTNLASS